MSVLLFKHRYAAVALAVPAAGAAAATVCMLFQLPFSVCVMDCDSSHHGRERKNLLLPIVHGI